MKILDVRTTLLRVPFTELLRASYGARTHASHLLVEVLCDDDVVGYGEVNGLFHETAEAFLHYEIKRLLIGEDPLRIEYLSHKMEHFLMWNSHAAYPIAAVDTALYDIKGKVLGVPVYELLGGLYRERIPITGLIHMHSIEEDVASAVRSVHDGHEVLKIKVGTNMQYDLDRLRAIRDAVGPNVPFRIDPNMAWSPRTAIKWIRKMEPLNIQWVEQPVPAWDFNGLLEVARAVDTPLSADESCMTVRDALVLAELRAVEAFNVYLMESGGITRLKEILSIANAAGIACVLGTWGEGGVSQAAMLHVAASSRNFEHASDSVAGLVEDDYTTEPFKFDCGSLLVPNGCGLGVTTDQFKIKKYARLQGEDRVFLGRPEQPIPAVGQVI